MGEGHCANAARIGISVLRSVNQSAAPRTGLIFSYCLAWITSLPVPLHDRVTELGLLHSKYYKWTHVPYVGG
jgi:hypothetical protein